MPKIGVFQAAAQGAAGGLFAVIILPALPARVGFEFRAMVSIFVNSLSQETTFGLK